MIVHTGSVNQEEALALTRHAAGSRRRAADPALHTAWTTPSSCHFGGRGRGRPGLPLYV